MSNFRDLQKLKGARNSYQLQNHNGIPVNGELSSFNYGSIALKQPSLNKNSKSVARQRQSLKLTPSKNLYQRAEGLGLSELSQRFTSKLIQNPKFSVYNFPLKLEMQNFQKDEVRFQIPTILNTQRKIKNNYVLNRDSTFAKRSTSFGKINETLSKVSKNSFNYLFAVGKGGFGKVWKVESKRTKQKFAMKEMSKAKIISRKSVASVMNQRNLLAKLSHPFIINMCYAFQDRENLYLVMDYLDGGDLRYHMGDRQLFNEKQTKFFMANIIIALEYLHDHRIIHRDLKPQNLVFDSEGYLKLTDLGVSRELRDDNQQDTSGTPGYMAPQVMIRRPHSYTADYFALGVIAYELMIGQRPYIGANRKEIKDQIMSRQVSVKFNDLPFKWSPFSLDFINKLLLRNPDQRLGATGIQELKDHPWLADIEWQKLKNRKINPPFKPVSIQEDYQNYKQQISQDTLNDYQDEILLMLRQPETQQLFERYEFEKKHTEMGHRKNTSYPTSSTEEVPGRK